MSKGNPMKFACEKCKHFEEVEGEPQGMCKAHPPHVSLCMVPQVNPLTRQQGMAMQVFTAYPRLNPSDSCGEWASSLVMLNG